MKVGHPLAREETRLGNRIRGESGLGDPAMLVNWGGSGESDPCC